VVKFESQKEIKERFKLEKNSNKIGVRMINRLFEEKKVSYCSVLFVFDDW